MINRFTAFAEAQKLYEPADRILLAVSGGIDSMAMWRLFDRTGIDYAIIHCNFQLRGAESDEDEKLVTRVAGELGVKLYVRRFDTQEYAAVSGISIEMAARELRYAWFEEVRKENHFRYVATAHHLDDLLETFFINITRKTGIRGMTGFAAKSGTVIRPMLFTNRAEIETWAKESDLEFRNDATNDEIVFQRNFIRHEIIPRLETLNPSFRMNLAESMRNLQEVEDFYQTEIDRQIRKVRHQDSSYDEISVSALLKLPHPKQVLFEWMSRHGFNASQVSDLYGILDAEPGRQFFSRTHRLVTGRDSLIVTPLPLQGEQLYYIEKDDPEMFEPVHLIFEVRERSGFEVIRDPRVACLDYDKLDFPLMLTKWKPGTWFQPLGMTGFKKISDFFTDEKFSLVEKEEAWILNSADRVAWIVGWRIDHRFRVTDETNNNKEYKPPSQVKST